MTNLMQRSPVWGKCGRYLLAGLLMSQVVSLTARAEPPSPAPIVRDAHNNIALRSLLEKNLQDMIQACIGTPLLMKKINRNKQVEVTAIPSWLSSNLNISGDDTFVNVVDGYNLTRIFGYVYPNKNVINVRPVSDDYLSVDFDTVNDQVVSAGSNMVIYSTTCASVIADKADVDAGYTFPLATIKAGLSAEFQGQNSYSLAIVAGTFESPLFYMYYSNRPGNDASIDKAFAALTFWKWYADHSASAGQYTLIKSFRGISIYKISALHKNVGLGVQLSGKVGIPIISLNNDLTGTVNTESRGQATGYLVGNYVKNGDSETETVPLPSPDTLVKDIADASPSLVTFDPSSAGDLTLVGGDKQFRQSFAGIPGSLCSPSAWRTTDESVFLIDAKPIVGAKRGACDISFKFSPSPADFESGKVVKFALVSTASVGSPPQKIRIDAQPVTFLTTKNPQMVFSGGSPSPRIQSVAGSDGVTLTWSLNFKLTTDAQRRIVQESDIDIDDVALNCPNSVSVYGSPQLSLNFSGPQIGNSRSLTLTVGVDSANAPKDAGASGNFAACTIGGPVVYSLPSGVQRRGKIGPVAINYPISTTRADASPTPTPAGIPPGGR